MDDKECSQVVEHAELIDMRTHLTVAMLAAAQLNRKTQHLPEATHLQDYLDQSLKSLVTDVGKVDALVTHAADGLPAVAEQPHQRRLIRPLLWISSGIAHGIHAVCAKMHRRHYTRIVAPSFYR